MSSNFYDFFKIFLNISDKSLIMPETDILAPFIRNLPAIYLRYTFNPTATYPQYIGGKIPKILTAIFFREGRCRRLLIGAKFLYKY